MESLPAAGTPPEAQLPNPKAIGATHDAANVIGPPRTSTGDQTVNKEGHAAGDESLDGLAHEKPCDDGHEDLPRKESPLDHPENPTAIKETVPSMHDQIKALKDQLFNLEKQATPRLDTKALKAEWESTFLNDGPEKLFMNWDAESKRRVDMSSTNGPWHGSGQERKNLTDDLNYNIKLLNLRREWLENQGNDLLQFNYFFDDEVDSDDVDMDSIDSLSELDPFDIFYEKRRVLDRTFHLDKVNLEIEYRARQWQREQRERRRRQRRRRQGARPERHAGDGQISDEDSSSGEDSKSVNNGNKAAKDEGSVVRSAIPKIRRVGWLDFRALRREDVPSAIDVLIGEPIIDDDDFFFQKNLYKATSQVRKAEKVQEKKAAMEEAAAGKRPLPERLRVHSREIKQILAKVHGSSLTDSTETRPVVLLRPFRILVYYNQAIRDWHQKLTVKFAKPDADTESVAAGTGRPPSEPAAIANTLGVDSSESNEPGSRVEEKPGQEESAGESKPKKELDVEDDTNSHTAFKHLGLLLEFMDTDLATRFNYLESSECRKVFFSDLWHLFQPGTYVIGRDGKQAYRVISVQSVEHRSIDPMARWYRNLKVAGEEGEEGDTPFTVRCVYLDFDGKQLGPVSKTFQIKRFEREKSVTSLDIYPLRFHSPTISELKGTDLTTGQCSGDRLWAHLVEQGKRFLKASAINLAAVQPMYYAGTTLDSMEEVESQVVVDFEAALAMEEHIKNGWRPELENLIGTAPKETDQKECSAECCRGEAVHYDSYAEKKRNEEFMANLLPRTREEMPSVIVFPRPLDPTAPETGLTEGDLVIMSSRVFGFVLRNRKWAKLDLTYLTDVQPSDTNQAREDDKKDINSSTDTAFDQLVLPDGHKDMILSLITQHFRAKGHNNRADIVRGKGKGLIILLHGAPGVGKTTTAEGIAEKFNKPLFQLTCGDLGTTAKDVEAALETNFALANRWGCILLLDEADVFLAQRTKEDFKRNGLVAVFLRVLEYYAGILFLTTNRVGDFDEAFASRIHISLYYPELNEDKTIQVFALNLKLIRQRFLGSSRTFECNEMDIGAFAQKYWKDNPFDHWNGRQIRNACQTALALAEYEAQGRNPHAFAEPSSKVTLKVSHFETVAKAYLEFSSYVREIHGTHAARRAKEAGLRAMWVDSATGKIVANADLRETRPDRMSRFKRQSQGKHPYHSPQQGFTRAPSPQMHQSQMGGQLYPPQLVQHHAPSSSFSYGNMATQHPGLDYPPPSKPQHFQTQVHDNLNPGYQDRLEGGEHLQQSPRVQVTMQGHQQQQQQQQQPYIPASQHAYGVADSEPQYHYSPSQRG